MDKPLKKIPTPQGPVAGEPPKPSWGPPISYATGGLAGLTYNPQGSGQEHDPFFAEVAPGVANSGNLKYEYGPDGDHWRPIEPPMNLKGD
jgi:hypothetical protein